MEKLQFRQLRSMINYLIDIKKKEDFIQKYIFPGGFLPSKNSLVEHAKKTGLEFTQCNSYGVPYSNTIKIFLD